ncbi:hypothetical protein FACS189440_07660 [Bacteroidia bacterium]|nr:hypothetical protein FACS189440_07660 [Bacteroidia bacterium]
MKDIKKLICEIKKLNVKSVSYGQYSDVAKIPYKVHLLSELMNCRMLDCCESVNLLIKKNHILPSVALIRAAFENIAVLNRVVLSIRKSLESNLLSDNFDELIMKIIFGTRYDEDVKAINILTQLDMLDKGYQGIRKFYDDLCEFVHPNWDGVEGSYSILQEDKGVKDILKVITKDHPIYNWFVACFIACMQIHIDLIAEIRNSLPQFAGVCEMDIQKKSNQMV